MIKKTITFTDYDGNERKEEFRFNLNKAEIIRMELTTKGGLIEMVDRAVKAKDVDTLFRIFEDLVQKSYGVKTLDGRGFTKKKEDLDDFMATEAYSELITELVTNAEAAADFVNGIIPANLEKQITPAVSLNT